MYPIPKIIHLTCKEKPVPDIYLPFVKRIIQLHPEWTINIYDDADANKTVKDKFSWLHSIYEAYPTSIQRTDMFRVLIVFLYGGFYMDMDMLCLKNLDSLCKLNLVLGEEKTMTVDACKAAQLKYSLRIANYMFGSIPGHLFWIDLLKAMAAKSSMHVCTENDVLESTGPGLVTDYYHETKLLYKDIYVLQNKDRLCLSKCGSDPSCHFGDFAAHFHLGSWRWQHKKNERQKQVPGKTAQTDHKEKAIQVLNTFINNNKKNNKNIIVLETYNKKEKPFDGLTNVFNELKDLGDIVSNTGNANNAAILVCGIPFLYEKQLSAKNTNIAFTTFESDQLPPAWVRSLNNYYQYCIVPHERVKAVFENSGINIPITVVQQGFKRYKRDFDRPAIPGNFTVGFLGVPVARKNLLKLYDACKLLQQEDIPDIKLVVHVAVFYDWLDVSAFQQIRDDDMVTWTTGKYTDDQIAEWYGKLSCYVYPSSGEGWSFTPRESLYLSVPTIISDIPLHDELMETGFYKPILSSGTEPANFDGHYHGNWHIITVEEITASIYDVYKNYHTYKTLAQEGAGWITDKWMNEDMQQSILNFINTI